MSDPDPPDSTILKSAAQHFTGCELEEDELDLLWRRLQDDVRTAEELADETGEPHQEIEAFLEWAADQGVIAQETLSDGRHVFAPSHAEIADVHAHHQLSKPSRGTRLKTFAWRGLVVAAVLTVYAPWLGPVLADTGLEGTPRTLAILAGLAILALYLVAIAGYWGYLAVAGRWE